VGKLIKNETGFSAVETILILVIVGVAGFVGWYVWHIKQATDKDLANTATTAPVVHKSAGTAQTGFLTIPQWGVKAPYRGDAGLTYKYTKDAGSSSEVAFYSAELAKVAPACVSDGTPIGVIKRYAPTDEFLGEDGTDLKETAATAFSQADSSVYKKIANYYYIANKPNGPCSPPGTPLATTTYNKAILAATSIFQGLELSSTVK
jgi:hypothetical protein